MEARIGTDEFWKNEFRKQRFISKRGLSFVIYSLLGPPIGGILTVLALWLPDQIALGWNYLWDNPGSIFANLPSMVGMGILGGYVIGGLQAAACGFLISLMSDEEGRFSYLIAFAAPATVALLGVIVLHFLLETGWPGSLFMVSAGIPSSLILRFLFRKRFRPLAREGN